MPTFTRKPPKGLKVTKERGWETTIHIGANSSSGATLPSENHEEKGS